MPLFRSSTATKIRTVARHEQLLFYPSFGSRVDGGWSLVIHGRVIDPRVSWLRRRPMLALARRLLHMDRMAEEYFLARTREFLMFGLRNRTVIVTIGGQERFVGESDYMGLFRGEVLLSDEQLSALNHKEGGRGWLDFRAVFGKSDDREIAGRVQLIEPKGISIISDVDDTIKHSNVPNRSDLFRNTFTRTFVPINGMPELYRACAEAGAAFHFVSASPWQLYEPLHEFMVSEGYPFGSFHLKRFRIRDSARKIRMSPQKAHKRAAIEPILNAFPDRQFVLIGDSGEQDPEIYAGLMKERPNQIGKIFIRTVRDESTDAGRLNAAFKEIEPDRWKVYREPAEINDVVPAYIQNNQPRVLP